MQHAVKRYSTPKEYKFACATCDRKGVAYTKSYPTKSSRDVAAEKHRMGN